jgi:hypothetical protein
MTSMNRFIFAILLIASVGTEASADKFICVARHAVWTTPTKSEDAPHLAKDVAFNFDTDSDEITGPSFFPSNWELIEGARGKKPYPWIQRWVWFSRGPENSYERYNVLSIAPFEKRGVMQFSWFMAERATLIRGLCK